MSHIIPQDQTSEQTFKFWNEDGDAIELEQCKISAFLFYYTGDRKRPTANVLATFQDEDFKRDDNQLTITIKPERMNHKRNGRVAFCLYLSKDGCTSKHFVSRHENGNNLLCN